MFFLDLVNKFKAEKPFNLLFYVLMDNHYHMIIEAQGMPIGLAMQRINRAYSHYYNQKYRCSGAVFGTRYHVYPVTDMPYFRQLLLYIAHNPVKAGIVKTPTDYRWSAHVEVASLKSNLVSAQRLFEILGGTAEKGSQVYDTLIRQNNDNVSKAPSIRAFNREYRVSQLSGVLEEIIKGRMTVTGIQSGRRDALAVRLRCEFIRKANDLGYSATEIARLLRVTDRYVRKTLLPENPS